MGGRQPFLTGTLVGFWRDGCGNCASELVPSTEVVQYGVGKVRYCNGEVKLVNITE
jgi:hypothetical protein